ncbi:unnamed protein product [Cladocopium goreaui]|uniref:Saposin B-type domain-containing protein n=1 Tax=Cladocopium goreaui TaxID=2562237 RepID=A0A9P1FLH0_9DINO|nr:unnamed protein product [Cladocopium goreaui]
MRCLEVGVLFIIHQAHAAIRMPEEFNVEKDFDVKNKYQKAQKYIRCDLCQMAVGNTFDSVGSSFTEDDVYDHIEKICDIDDLYAKHELLEVENGWKMAQVSESDSRSAHAVRWQSHAMKELCDNIVRPYDDEIKDIFLKHLKKGGKKVDSPELRADVIGSAVVDSTVPCHCMLVVQEHLVVQNTRTRTVDVAVMKRSLEERLEELSFHILSTFGYQLEPFKLIGDAELPKPSSPVFALFKPRPMITDLTKGPMAEVARRRAASRASRCSSHVPKGILLHLKMGAANGVPAPWAVLVCETPCCDQHNFLVENNKVSRVGLALETSFEESKDLNSKGFSRMEIVCASELDSYRINRWAKDESDAQLAQRMEALPPALTSMMPLAPPEGYLADAPDGQMVCDFGTTTELVEYDTSPLRRGYMPSLPTSQPDRGDDFEP